MEIASDFDHTQLQADEIFEVGRTLQEDLPITWSTANGGYWIVSRRQDLVDILKNPGAFTTTHGSTIPSFGQPVPALPTESDPPDHNVYRSVLAPFLTPGTVRANEETVRAIVSDAIDGFIERGEADFVSDLAQPVPIRVMAHFFGFEEADAQFVFETFTELVQAGSRGDAEARKAGVQAYFAWLRRQIADRRANPQDDLPSAIVAATKDGQPLTDDECIGILWSAAAGAVETTAHAIGHGLHMLDADREARERLAADPSLMPRAVEEILRFGNPTFFFKRTVVRDVTFGGVEMRAGDQLLICYGWASRDRAEFESPEQFRLDRVRNQHMSFGHGIHKCVGMHLARQEIGVVIEEVLRRLPDYERTATTVPSLRGGVMWAYSSIPVRFTPGPVAGVGA